MSIDDRARSKRKLQWFTALLAMTVVALISAVVMLVVTGGRPFWWVMLVLMLMNSGLFFETRKRLLADLRSPGDAAD